MDNKLNNIPFKELMEIVNAKHGFYYNADSKKKLDRYTGKVSRRIVRGSERRSKKGWGASRIFRAFIPKGS